MRYSLDTETYKIAAGREAPRLVCMSLAWSENGMLQSRLYDRHQALGVARDLIADPNNEIVGTNIAYDFGVLAQACKPTEQDRGRFLKTVFSGYDQGRFCDVEVYERLKLIALGRYKFDPETDRKTVFNLAALVAKYLGRTLTGKETVNGVDPWRLRYHELYNVPLDQWPQDATDYALGDATSTWQVFEAQLAQDGTEWPDFRAQCKNAWGLHLTSMTGYRTNAVAVENLVTQARQTYDSYTLKLIDYGICAQSGKRNMAYIRELVSEAYSGNPPLTDGGKSGIKQVSTDRETLSASGNYKLQDLAKRGEVEKIITTYGPRLSQGVTYPINPYYNVLVETGRTSGPDQQHPREGGVRECIEARYGNVLMPLDYRIAELRGLSQVLYSEFGWSKMRDALCEGMELHLLMAAQILGISYDECVRRYALGDKEVKEARQLAKAANFGLPGGLGPDSFIQYAWEQYDLRLDPDPIKARARAVQIKETFLETFPEIRLFFKGVATHVSASGGRATITQYYSGRIRGNVSFTNGCNTYFQGIVADWCKEANYEVNRACFGASDLGTRDPLYGCRTILFYHDEIVGEAPIERAHDACMRQQSIMESVAQKYCPDVPTPVSVALCYRYSKNAEKTLDANGRLIPYEDAA